MVGTARLTLSLACAALAALVLLPAVASAATINVVAGMGEGVEDDQCSLREAITTAGTNNLVNSGVGIPDCTQGQSSLDTINLPAGTYTIGATSDEQLNVSGDYDVQVANGNVSIVGAGSGTTIIDAENRDRVIDVFGSGMFTLTGVTLTDGTTTSAIGGGGGGIQVATGASATLTNVAVTASFATNISGGGIALNSTAAQSLTNVTVSGNTSNGDGSGPSGGGIFAAGGTITITDSTISGNTSTHDAGDTDGIGLGGGGINFDSGATGIISRTTISGNTATTANATQFPSGGGILHEGGAANLTISDSTISGNTVSGGNSRGGGGMDFESNGSADQLRIDNTTFSGNGVTSAASSRGGGISATSGTIDIANATFTANTAEAASGDGISFSTNNLANGSTLEVRGSILDEGGANECHEVGINVDITSAGYNFERGNTNDCSFAGTGEMMSATSPISATLASNGGPTQTHLLNAGQSPVDAIPAAACLNSAGATQAADQRGVLRPGAAGGVNCDTGAYERAECGSFLITIVGTGGNDTITGTAAGEGIMGIGGGDTIDPGDGADCVLPGTGDDTIHANADSDNDQIVDEGGSDTLTIANEGNVDGRTLSVGSGFGTTSGPGFGGDLFTDIENAIGSPGDDTLLGDEVVNVLDGGDGDDTLNGGTNDDTLTGGEGGETNGDTISFSGAAVAIIFDLAAGSPQNAGQGNDTFSGMENVLGGSAGDALRGDGTNNIINGGFGAINDTLEGRGGDDTLDGGTGPGAGTGDGAGDTVVYDEAASGVTVDVSFASAQNTIGDGMDTILDTENVTGSAHDDVLVGSAVANLISGLNGNDRASFNNGGVGVIANLATDSATGQGTDQLPNIENLEGSANADTLTGDDGVNLLIGQGGGDTLTGAGGSDLVQGGIGGDNIFIRDSVGDSADCGPDLDADTVQADLMGTDTLTNCDGMDTITFAAPVTPVTPVTPTTPTTTKKKCPKGKKLKKVKGKKKCVKKKKKRSTAVG